MNNEYRAVCIAPGVTYGQLLHTVERSDADHEELPPMEFTATEDDEQPRRCKCGWGCECPKAKTLPDLRVTPSDIRESQDRCQGVGSLRVQPCPLVRPEDQSGRAEHVVETARSVNMLGVEGPDVLAVDEPQYPWSSLGIRRPWIMSSMK